MIVATIAFLMYKNIFEKRSTRIKRIVYKTLGVILTIILLFIWLWLVIIFMASIFALLDGIKIYGINIALLGIVLIVLIFLPLGQRIGRRMAGQEESNMNLSKICVLFTKFGLLWVS